jgi:hypothetical protein
MLRTYGTALALMLHVTIASVQASPLALRLQVNLPAAMLPNRSGLDVSWNRVANADALQSQVAQSNLQQSGAQTTDSSDPTLSRQKISPPKPSTDKQNSGQIPVGTAVAPEEQLHGVPASTPSGAAIAPGKQKRIHSFSVRVALLVGAAIAVGTVAGASLASSSRPR